ncbi:biopolymer transporter [Crocosphaera sp. XPORK-15E]|uniref:TolB family protein n=1 Tax=Crocosphaera sp. XPORK-15E TaxID=3110247 RepID=UPI002B2000DF|nr:biopolymer transporter [Crocosphaera sp. XPORK-15E]MEA5534245.1 biopolymer transporter [Crocosphaera sp. XPORK-15E]
MLSIRFPFSVILFLGIILTGCNHPLLITPQILTGGVNSKSPEEYPAYSGDGRYLAFASDRQGHRDIYLYDLEQRRLVSLPNLNRRDSSQDQPALSTDGRYLAYVSTERGKPDIMVYDRLKQRSELLSANVRGSVRQPTITGDGSKVAFQTNQLGEWNIAIVERNTP